MYQTGKWRYSDFCRVANLTPFLASESIPATFVAFVYKVGLAAGTVKPLAAVRHAQIALVLGDPNMACMPKLEYVTKGLWRKTAGRNKGPRLPITPTVLLKLKGCWERLPCKEDATMLWE